MHMNHSSLRALAVVLLAAAGAAALAQDQDPAPDPGRSPADSPDVSEEDAAGPAGTAVTAAADGEDDTPGGQVIPGAPDAAEVEPAGGADEAPAAATGDASTDAVPGTDDESYLDIDEEDFRPSEEIPTDQSIPFPTDI